MQQYLRAQNYESYICTFYKDTEKVLDLEHLSTVHSNSTDAMICFHIQCSQINGLTVSQVTKSYYFFDLTVDVIYSS